MKQLFRLRHFPEKLVIWVWLFTAFITAFFWWWSAREDRYELEVETRHVYHNISTLTRALDEHIRLSLSQLDGELLFIKSRYETGQKQLEELAPLLRTVSNKQFSLSMSIFDQQGDLVATTLGEARFSAADRDYFQYHQANSQSGLYIGKPIIGKLLGKPAFTLSRKLSNPDGSFGGVVVVTVDPSYFSNFYESMHLPESTIISVVGTADGVVRIRRIGTYAEIGQVMPPDAPLFRYASQASEGVFNTKTVVDQSRRFIAYRKMADYPLIVDVGMDEKAALTDYYNHRNSKMLLLLAANFLLVLYSFLLTGSIRRRNKEYQSRVKLQEQLKENIVIAGKIQKALLPHPKVDDRVEIATIFEPYDQLSGDFWGTNWLNNKLRGFIVDVLGHGLATALQTSALNALLNEQMTSEDTFGPQMLQTLNEKISPYFTEESFAAVLLFEFDFAAGELTMLTGGINHVIANTGGETRVIAIRGSLVGVAAHPDFGTAVIPFAAGDYFFFASDGLTDQVKVEDIPKGFTKSMRWLEALSTSPDRWDDCSAIGVRILRRPTKHPYSCTFTGTAELGPVRDEIRNQLLSLTGQPGMLEVGINEAVNNAVKAVDSEGPVTVRIRLLGRRLVVRVKDGGPGFDWQKRIAAAELVGDERECLFNENGRGIRIMLYSFDTVRYNRSGNEVLLAKRL
ncbi:MAG: SpoIIE family protein phosphatase [Negativicutes bacterium]|nr:SpoIIE family protein phosphatase [Negativicutes bacterium]